MKKKLFYFIVLFALLPICTSCNRDVVPIQEDENLTIVGSNDFFNNLFYFKGFETRSGEISGEEIFSLIQPLFEPAIQYLSLNGYDYSTDFEDGDPTIILTALGLLEADYTLNIETRAPGVMEVVGCVLLGDTLKDLAGTGAMLIAKRIASRLLERAIPYVGAAVMVGSAAACIYEAWD